MLTHEYQAQCKNDLFTTPERPSRGADDYEEGQAIPRLDCAAVIV